VALRSKSSLSQPKKWLVELMQSISFGQVTNLRVDRGEPLIDPPPQVIRKIKLGGENGPRPEAHCEDFLLKQQVSELFDVLGSVTNGDVVTIEVKHGLPFSVEIVHGRVVLETGNA
jgi:hypothetical protein